MGLWTTSSPCSPVLPGTRNCTSRASASLAAALGRDDVEGLINGHGFVHGGGPLNQPSSWSFLGKRPVLGVRHLYIFVVLVRVAIHFRCYISINRKEKTNGWETIAPSVARFGLGVATDLAQGPLHGLQHLQVSQHLTHRLQHLQVKSTSDASEHIVHKTPMPGSLPGHPEGTSWCGFGGSHDVTSTLHEISLPPSTLERKGNHVPVSSTLHLTTMKHEQVQKAPCCPR